MVPGSMGHLRRHHLIDGPDQATLVGIGFHAGQMLDVVRFDRREHERHTTGRVCCVREKCRGEMTWITI